MQVKRNSLAASIEQGQSELCIGLSLLRRLAIPFQRLLVIGLSFRAVGKKCFPTFPLPEHCPTPLLSHSSG